MGRLVLAGFVLAVAAGCGPDTDPSAPGSGESADSAAASQQRGTGGKVSTEAVGDPAGGAPADDGKLVLRAGDSLLDLGPLARLSDLPLSSLPHTIAALSAGPVLMRSPTLLAGAWAPVARVPDGWAELLQRYGDPPLWRAASPMPVLAGSEPPVVRVNGTSITSWSEETHQPGETLVWWDASSQALLAVGEEPPAQVAIDGWVDPLREFGSVERGLIAEDGRAAAAALRGTFTLDDLLLDTLLLPAPGRWEVAVDELRAERLEVSVGLLDRAWLLAGDVLHRSRQRTDGVVMAVEVLTAEGQVDRLWSLALDGSAAGQAYHEALVDLSAYQGQALTLRLVTEAGPMGNSDFDYALWGGLRLRGAPRRAPSRPHVVLIDIDTLRADRLGAYGSQRGLTPQLDTWAQSRGTVFTDALSVASWTLPATVSMLTGLAVHQHGVERAVGALGEGLPTLASLLRQSGYETLAVASGGYLRPAFGLAQGFERYRTAEPDNTDFSEALGWLTDRSSERPFFLFVHTYAVHAPYPFDAARIDPNYDGPFAGADVDYGNVMDPYREGELTLTAGDKGYVTALYDGLVATMDGAIGDLLKQLGELVGDEPMLVVFTSDHGEALFEHEVLGHGQEVYQELLSVPLVIAFPNDAERVLRRDDPASLVDIVPTVLDVVGLPIPQGLAGRSLLESQPEHRVRVARHFAEIEQRAVISAGLKLIERWAQGNESQMQRELYDLTLDPGERSALDWQDDPRVRALQHRLEVYQADHAAPPATGSETATIDDDAQAQLRALGYLGDG